MRYRLPTLDTYSIVKAVQWENMEVPTGKIAWLLKPFTLHDLIIILLKKEHKIGPMAYLTLT